MTEEKVPVVLKLSRPVYRALVAIAIRKGTQVHLLIENVVERSLTVPVAARTGVTRKAPRPARDDVDRRIVDLNASGHGDNQISKIIGLHQTSVSRRRREMGLESPTPKAGYRR